MATISLLIQGPRVGSFNYTININDDDAGRIVAAFGSQMPPLYDENGEERQPTAQEIVMSLSQWIERQVFARTLAIEKLNIKRQADEQAQNVPPIVKI